MKSRILITAAALMLSFGAFAQWGEEDMRLTPEQQAAHIKERVDQMDTVVKLSPQERMEVEKLFTDNSKETRDAFSYGDRTQAMEKVGTIKEEQNKKLKEILGEERFKKYSESMMKKGYGEKPREVNPATPEPVYPGNPIDPTQPGL